ncbi:hypothetical protein, partial [Escherichia coli]
AKYFDPNSSYENLIKSRFGNGSDFYTKTDSFTYAGVYNYDTAQKKGGPIALHTIKQNKLIENIRADNFLCDSVHRKWKFLSIVRRTIDGRNETAVMQDS